MSDNGLSKISAKSIQYWLTQTLYARSCYICGPSLVIPSIPRTLTFIRFLLRRGCVLFYADIKGLQQQIGVCSVCHRYCRRSRSQPGPGDELCSAAKKLPKERGGVLTNAALFRINRQGSLCCFCQSVEALGPHHVSVLKWRSHEVFFQRQQSGPSLWSKPAVSLMQPSYLQHAELVYWAVNDNWYTAYNITLIGSIDKWWTDCSKMNIVISWSILHRHCNTAPSDR